MSCGCGPQGLILLQVPHRATSRGRSPATPSKEEGEWCPSLSPQPWAPNFTSPEQHRAPAPAPFESGPGEKAGLGWPASLEVSPGPHQTTLAQGWAETPFLPRLLLAKAKLEPYVWALQAEMGLLGRNLLLIAWRGGIGRGWGAQGLPH